MALLKLVVLISIFAVVFAEDPCSNSGTETTNDMEDFQKYLDLPIELEINKKYPVVAGELSPLVPCGLMRKKRKAHIMPSQAHVFRSRFFNRGDEDATLRNKCPVGYRRIAFRCVKS